VGAYSTAFFDVMYINKIVTKLHRLYPTGSELEVYGNFLVHFTRFVNAPAITASRKCIFIRLLPALHLL